EADCLYANSLTAMIVCSLAGRWTRQPVIWHVHDILTREHFSAINLRVCRIAARLGVTRAIANSHATADAFRQRISQRIPVDVIYNGIDERRFVDLPPANLKRERCVIGVFGRLAPWKGQHVLLKALTHLPDTELMIVGDALFGETDYVERLHKYVDEHDLTDRVRFMGFRDDIPELLAQCDIVAHTSTAPEPFGRVVVEAMLAGRPIVATRAGGVPELVEHGRTGILVSAGDADALAAALSDLIKDTNKRYALAEAGQRNALKRFTLRQILQQWNSVIANLTVPNEKVNQAQVRPT
ncbi:MAG: glycosyltransferase family 4 protein, partial [Rhodospirillales bacterium]|nr:glycosyltransferase family 4 protein [Rhodospirillales bacterium]